VRGIGRSLVRLGRQLEALAAHSSAIPEPRQDKSSLEAPAQVEVVVASTVATTSFKGLGYSIGGTFRSAACASALYRDLLSELWRRYPDARDAMQRAMQRGSRGRAYVSSHRERLYPGKPAVWVSMHSRELPGGWWVGTNESQATLRRLTARALRALEPAVQKDITIRWERRS
jgi:hypothetical protein